MSDNTENHTLALLQEMRAEMKAQSDAMNNRFSEVNERFDEVNLRLDGLTHIVTLLAGNMGSHEDRITALEEAAKLRS